MPKGVGFESPLSHSISPPLAHGARRPVLSIQLRGRESVTGGGRTGGDGPCRSDAECDGECTNTGECVAAATSLFVRIE